MYEKRMWMLLQVCAANLFRNRVIGLQAHRPVRYVGVGHLKLRRQVVMEAQPETYLISLRI